VARKTEDEKTDMEKRGPAAIHAERSVPDALGKEVVYHLRDDQSDHLRAAFLDIHRTATYCIYYC